MWTGWDRICSDLRQAGDERQLFERFACSVQEFGFEYCSYGIRAALPVSNPAVMIFDSYPSGWMTHYRENNFLTVDPTVQLGARSPNLIVWSDQTFSSAPRLWGDAQDFGLSVGIAQATWGAHGIFGLLTLARSNDALFSTEVSHLGTEVLFAAHQLHALMCLLLEPKLLPGIDITLTAREREVMRWTGEGKTAYVIGNILNISERTVNFHVNNVLVKLNCTNKIQAVVKAFALGLIDAG
ncbi:autoinducer binding domain-containing protein [Caballeronia sp. SEWSISQ10-4 2]|uniref:autoinducer binding domain-containing protein n=1 Tax=Caballeronia sp. SEWSISQ10-4 2 TaxID=2937438 RepID=UPI00264B5361|nr:autoinducer binding domain-containing protein [Caballeronia sp. SEWSISQ10-4 2]MDN7183361.1 autoinducer binding domain-containing protein [Caballeronia sp. SEWSISQ10-4 2]